MKNYFYLFIALLSSSMVMAQCSFPTEYEGIRISDTEAVFDANDQSGTFDIEGGLVGFTPKGQASHGMSNVTLPYFKDGLVSGRAYEYYVRKNCANGEHTEWYGPYLLKDEPDCDAPAPIQISVSRISETEAIFDVPQQFQAGTYDFEAGLAGFTPKGKANFGMENVSVPYTKNNLINGYDYEFYYKRHCPNGGSSEWFGPVSVPNICTFPQQFEFKRTSVSSAYFTAVDKSGTFDIEIGTGNSTFVGEPNYGMDDITLPYYRNDLANTEYTFFIRKNCENGVMSDWQGPFSLPVPSLVKINPTTIQAGETITFDSAVNNVKVFDYNGKSVKINQTANGINIPTSVKAGVYIMQIEEANGNVSNVKFIVK